MRRARHSNGHVKRHKLAMKSTAYNEVGVLFSLCQLANDRLRLDAGCQSDVILAPIPVEHASIDLSFVQESPFDEFQKSGFRHADLR
jgi:hypothetical protein